MYWVKTMRQQGNFNFPTLLLITWLPTEKDCPFSVGKVKIALKKIWYTETSRFWKYKEKIFVLKRSAENMEDYQKNTFSVKVKLWK